ncbi:hypothetical protein Dimus_031356, partial [Dionaea muscipula]
ADTTPGQQHSHHQRVKETPSCHLIPLLGIHHQEAGRSFLISLSAGMAPPVINQAESSSQRLPSPLLLDDDRAAAAGRAPLRAAESDQTTPRTSSDPSQLLDDDSAPAVKKRERWTKDEHRMFLIGLEIFNKGQWKIISKEIFSGKKTEAQIASHAQNYFQRQKQLLQEQGGDAGHGGSKRKWWWRLHDINTVEDKELGVLVSKKLISKKIEARFRAAREQH